MTTRNLNKSKQRDAILTYLQSRKDHPTADQIYDAVRKEIPNISLGTVYRNLSLLTEIGQIIKLSCGDSSEHFDATTTPHTHFVCNNCGKVKDIKTNHIDIVNTLVSPDFPCKIEGHNIIFYGSCEICMKK